MTFHMFMSFLKSFVRVAGYIALLYDIGIGVGFLIVAEGLGVVEEL